MADLKILITAQNQATAALRQVENQLHGLVSASGSAAKGMSGLQNIAKAGLAGGFLAASVGATALVGGIGAAAVGGLQLNSSMEMVSAQLEAFTKDGAKAQAILEGIRTEAATTPFEFEEMARATASLLPAAKQSGAELMDLVRMSEILAASNPAQGLEGAAFALKEALSGDFVSLVSRFNLPRQTLNRLKEEGVPAMEAVTMALNEMGLDMDLVANLSQTASGRWSTLKDSLATLQGQATLPLFEAMKTSMIGLQSAIDANLPALQEMADVIGGYLVQGFQTLYSWVVRIGPIIGSGVSAAIPRFLEFSATVAKAVEPVTSFISYLFDWQDALAAVAIVVASVVIPALVAMMASIAPLIAVFVGLMALSALFRSAWESNFMGIQDVAAQAFAEIPTIIETAKSTIVEIFNAIQAAWVVVAEYFGPSFTRLSESIGVFATSFQPVLVAIQGLWAAASPVLFALAAVVGGILLVAVEALGAVFRNIGPIVVAAVNQATAILNFLVSTVTGIFGIIKSLVTGDWAGAWESAKQVGQGFVDFMASTFGNFQTVIVGILTAIQEVIGGVADALGFDTVAKNIDESIASLQNFSQWITDIFSGERSLSIAMPNWLTSVTEWSWPTIPPAPEWVSTLVKWLWPSLPGGDWIVTLLAWSWPSIPGGDWIVTLIAWAWPDLPGAGWISDLLDWEWPSLPSLPAWLGGSPTGEATGTSFFPGGTALVGERGPERIFLPRGSKVFSTERTAAMSGGAVTVSIGPVSLGSGIDVQVLAYQVADILRRGNR